MNKSLSICAVITSYEPDNSLIRLYYSIRNQVSEILIVDNNSISEKSNQILKYMQERGIIVIKNDKNYGVAAALNQGAKYAEEKGYKWLLTLDQDSEFFTETYEILLKAYDNDFKDKEKIMIISPRYIERNNANLKKGITEKSKPKNLGKGKKKTVRWKDAVLNLTSGSLIKTESFKHIGFFDEKLFIEQVDNDFCYRLIKNGYKIKIAQNIIFLQEIGNAQKKFGFIVRNHLPVRKYYLARNTTIMLKRYFITAPYTTVRYFLGGTIFGWIKILFFEKNKISKTACGIKGLFAGIFF